MGYPNYLSRRALFGAGAGIAAGAALSWNDFAQASTKGGPDKLNFTPMAAMPPFRLPKHTFPLAWYNPECCQ